MDFLCQSEFVIFKFQPVAYINTKGEQGNGDFRDYAGGIILDKGIVTVNINDSTVHFTFSL